MIEPTDRGFRYSFNVLPFGREDVAVSIDRVARAGYDGIELAGEPDWYPSVDQLRRMVRDAGIVASSICALYGHADRDLIHPDAEVRRRAVAYVGRASEMAAELGAQVVVVGPSRWSRMSPQASVVAEWGWAVESLRAAGEHARGLGVTLGLEPWNRYETYFMNRTDQAAALATDVGLSRVGVHGDTFHMNIEERLPVADAFRALGSLLVHTHLADTNRGAPGDGHLDFVAILAALRDIAYTGWICVEPALPPVRDVGAPTATGLVLDDLVGRSIQRLVTAART